MAEQTLKKNTKKNLAELLAFHHAKFQPRSLNEGECQTPRGDLCNLCYAKSITYEQEVRSKNTALREFWASLKTGVPLESLVVSPLGRNYRTVTKRKVFVSRDKYVLGLIGVNDDDNRSFAMNIVECIIEPKEHNAIYQTIQTYFQQPRNGKVGEIFNYIVVKGLDELSIIFNVNDNSAFSRKILNQLSKYITKHIPQVKNVFVFIDEERSKYYMSAKAKRSGKASFQKIYGKSKLFHATVGKKFLYSPLAFTQTNHSILEKFITTAAEMLQLQNTDTLYDLYCGYGLFGIALAGKAKELIGVEANQQAIDDAKENAVRNKTQRAKFFSAKINAETVQRIFRHSGNGVKVLLDPPRNGTGGEVIEYIASKEPEAVVHIFCNSEIISTELQRWNECGYSVQKVIPFDMFPGTNEIEIMALLKPERIE